MIVAGEADAGDDSMPGILNVFEHTVRAGPTLPPKTTMTSHLVSKKYLSKNQSASNSLMLNDQEIAAKTTDQF